ncbi:hypothetical protein [Phycisphaera mikurensis]|uniref:Uncharacterized protein n=1 Tax=Phycisphaera mikurensis (strain NBRC 102666 / KCTC 22515 / FYK2301M01) TaxID=1142394 RepID=I0IEP3_PHYMF|nr:hypothetical protein [Phycisphaera mikurensis]MBB6441528.1 hypothetical protein [Phycisphaera mikurensis]BAM03731.1 hypothetical protein PSMK_15720 [Phycisphaera mikurensis NBRC 102666]
MPPEAPAVPERVTTPLPASRVAGLSFVLLLVLTGTAAAAGPSGWASDSGRRSAAMLMATLQDAARRLADAEAAPQRLRPRAVAAPAGVPTLAPQTPRHTPPLRPSLCVLPPPAG